MNRIAYQALTLLLVLTFVMDAHASQRTRKKAPRRKISVEEAQARAEREVFWRDEVAAIRRIEQSRRDSISYALYSLLHAHRMYKLTGDVEAFNGFYSDTNQAVVRRAMESLPDGSVKNLFGEAVESLDDAVYLHSTRFSAWEISKSRTLEIVERYNLEGVPRGRLFSKVMGVARSTIVEAGVYAIRAGIPIELNK